MKSHYTKEKIVENLIEIETFPARRHVPSCRHGRGTSPDRSSQCRGVHCWFPGYVCSADRVGSHPGTAAYAD